MSTPATILHGFVWESPEAQLGKVCCADKEPCLPQPKPHGQALPTLEPAHELRALLSQLCAPHNGFSHPHGGLVGTRAHLEHSLFDLEIWVGGNIMGTNRYIAGL